MRIASHSKRKGNEERSHSRRATFILVLPPLWRSTPRSTASPTTPLVYAVGNGTGRPSMGEIREVWGIPDLLDVLRSASLRFVFACLFGARRFGLWLELEASGQAGASAFELSDPAHKLKGINGFPVYRMRKAWNALPLLSLLDQRVGPPMSAREFSQRLPSLLLQLPQAVRKDFGFPTVAPLLNPPPPPLPPSLPCSSLRCHTGFI